jgi:tetratricopeptide (TPR) repeat protein
MLDASIAEGLADKNALQDRALIELLLQRKEFDVVEALVAKALQAAAEDPGWLFKSDNNAYCLCQAYYAANRPKDVIRVLQRFGFQGGGDLSSVFTVGATYGIDFNDDKWRLPLGYYAAWAFSNAGDRALAKRILERLLFKAPTVDEAFELYNRLCGVEALKTYDAIHRFFPWQPRALVWKADKLLELGRPAEALASVRDAIEWDPSDIASGDGYRFRAYEVLRRIDLRLGNRSGATDCEKRLSAARVADKAERAADLGFLPQAVALYRQSLAISSTDYRSEEHLALCLDSLGQFDEAARHRQNAYRLMPGCFGRATEVDYNMRDLLEAPDKVVIGLPVLMAHPKTASVCYLLGRGEAALGNSRKAVKLLEQATALDPKYLAAWDSLVDLGQKGYLTSKQTEAVCYRILDLDPTLRRDYPFVLDVISDLRPVYRRFQALASAWPPTLRGRLLPVRWAPMQDQPIPFPWSRPADGFDSPAGTCLIIENDISNIALWFREQ